MDNDRNSPDQSDAKSSVGNRQATPTSKRVPMREVNYRHSAQFIPILEHLGSSLLVSTYAAGKVVTVGVEQGGEEQGEATGSSSIRLGFSNFQQAMGIAVGPRGLAVGGPNLIWMLRDAGSLAAQISPPGTYDRGFLARESFVTGNISVHEMAWGETGELWVVNTLFSCLCTLHEDFNFVPRWQPSFITELAPQDRCHLNGMAMEAGKPKYVTALGTSNEARGWKPGKSDGGVILDVDSGEIVARGFCMPHSPRLRDGKLFVLDSGRGHLAVVDPKTGTKEVVADYPGYGRGMSIHGQFAFIGMSKARETSVFGGVPICEDRSLMRCGVVVVDLIAGKSVAYLEFETGVEELFDVKVLPGVRRPVINGPFAIQDQQTPVWVIPPPDSNSELLSNSSTGDTISRRVTL